MNRVPHRHRRVGYGHTLATYVRLDVCPVCNPPRWKVLTGAVLRFLSTRLDQLAASIDPGGAT